jgi:S1-C subfamily serine protease
MTRKNIIWIIVLAFFVGAAGSVAFNRVIFPKLSTVRGFAWVGKLQSSTPVVINRREEVRLNEGVNLIELTKQAQTVVVSIFSTGANPVLLGNGLIITSDGTIFTTKDAVKDNGQVTVVTNDGAVYPGLVRAMDPKSPMAVVSIAARDLPVAQFSDAGNMQTAQRVFALGKTTQEFTRQFASGMVIRTMGNQIDFARVLSSEVFESTIATDADLNADFIGGPVVNLQGLIIGMVVGSAGQILPSEAVDGAVRTYLEKGRITRPYIGMTYQMIGKNLAKVRSLPSGGAQVAAVEANSPAARAGLAAGDLITEVNGQKVESSSLEQVLLQQNTDQLRLRIRRGAEERDATLTVEQR